MTQEKKRRLLLDLIDRLSDKETHLRINLEDLSTKIAGRPIGLSGKVSIVLETLKSPKGKGV